MNCQAKQAGCFTVGQLAKLAGVSTRTLRHYEDVGLLAPSRDESGYRVYDSGDAKRLAQVMSLRACGLPLNEIRRLFEDPQASLRDSLAAHLRNLRAQDDSLRDAIARTEAAITLIERMEGMEAKGAFEELKEQGLREFEETYGQEARQRYGDDAIDSANARMMALTRDEWDAKELLEESIKVQLRIAMAGGDPTSGESHELARMHAKWIRVHWGDGYNRDAHLGLAHGYLCDERFTAYYDGACGKGATAFLVSALEANL